MKDQGQSWAELGGAVPASQASDETIAPGLTSQADVGETQRQDWSNHNRSPPSEPLRVTGMTGVTGGDWDDWGGLG